jgi:hypothetical protein
VQAEQWATAYREAFQAVVDWRREALTRSVVIEVPKRASGRGKAMSANLLVVWGHSPTQGLVAMADGRTRRVWLSGTDGWRLADTAGDERMLERMVRDCLAFDVACNSVPSSTLHWGRPEPPGRWARDASHLSEHWR